MTLHSTLDAKNHLFFIKPSISMPVYSSSTLRLSFYIQGNEV